MRLYFLFSYQNSPQNFMAGLQQSSHDCSMFVLNLMVLFSANKCNQVSSQSRFSFTVSQQTAVSQTDTTEALPFHTHCNTYFSSVR